MNFNITINGLEFNEAYGIFCNDSWFNKDKRNNKERFINISSTDLNISVEKTSKNTDNSISIGNGVTLSNSPKLRKLKLTRNFIQRDLNKIINEINLPSHLNKVCLEFLFSVVSNQQVFSNFKALYFKFDSNISESKLAYLSHWAYLINNKYGQENDPIAKITTKTLITIDNGPNESEYNKLYNNRENLIKDLRNYIYMDIDRSNKYTQIIQLH